MKITTVTAFKYDGHLFENKRQVNVYIKAQQDHKTMLEELSKTKYLDKPEKFTIKEGYFDFLVFPTESILNEDYKQVCYKTKSFTDALEKVMKRRDCKSLDYECVILDKNKASTGFTIDINKMPKNHPVHKLM